MTRTISLDEYNDAVRAAPCVNGVVDNPWPGEDVIVDCDDRRMLVITISTRTGKRIS